MLWSHDHSLLPLHKEQSQKTNKQQQPGPQPELVTWSSSGVCTAHSLAIKSQLSVTFSIQRHVRRKISGNGQLQKIKYNRIKITTHAGGLIFEQKGTNELSCAGPLGGGKDTNWAIFYHQNDWRCSRCYRHSSLRNSSTQWPAYMAAVNQQDGTQCGENSRLQLWGENRRDLFLFSFQLICEV